MSGEKTRKLDTLAKLFQATEVELYVDKTVGQLTKVRTPRRLKNIEQTNYENSAQQIALHLVLTKKSVLNLNDKDVAWSMSFVEMRTWRHSSTILQKMQRHETFRS